MESWIIIITLIVSRAYKRSEEAQIVFSFCRDTARFSLESGIWSLVDATFPPLASRDALAHVDMGVGQCGAQTHLLPELENRQTTSPLSPVSERHTVCPPDHLYSSISHFPWTASKHYKAEFWSAHSRAYARMDKTAQPFHQSSLIVFLLMQIQSNIPVVCKCPFVISEYAQQTKIPSLRC